MDLGIILDSKSSTYSMFVSGIVRSPLDSVALHSTLILEDILSLRRMNVSVRFT